jgi:hypothetical protein
MEKMDNSMIRPGLAADVVDKNRHMKSMIYEVIDRRVIIAQTAPPLTKFSLKHQIILTFLVRTGGSPQRYGVNAEVMEIIMEYDLASTTVVAIGLLQKGGIEKYDLRSDFRVPLPVGSGIDVSWNRRPLHVIDLSLGGVKFSYRGDDFPAVNKEIKLAVSIDGQVLYLSAMVLGVTTPASQDPDVHHVRVMFTSSRSAYEQHFMKKMIDIQRRLIAEGKLL